MYLFEEPTSNIPKVDRYHTMLTTRDVDTHIAVVEGKDVVAKFMIAANPFVPFHLKQELASDPSLIVQWRARKALKLNLPIIYEPRYRNKK
jgi:hypothetical protein